jgi:predicted  nucleic acid-binding Zn-ribbon protein
MVVASLPKRFETLTDTIEKNNSARSTVQASLEILEKETSILHQKVSDLENKLSSTNHKVFASLDILEETVAHVNLKSETYSKYHEQLLYNLKYALYDTLSTIRKDKCCTCDKTFAEHCDHAVHVEMNHLPLVPPTTDYTCDTCDFTSEPKIY